MKQISPHFWAENGGKQISYIVGSTNLFDAPESQGVILPTQAGVKISIFLEVGRSQSPKVAQMFRKNRVKYLKICP